MNTQNSTITKLAGQLLWLRYAMYLLHSCRLRSLYRAVMQHPSISNAFCVLAALLIGGVYGGLSGAIGMGIADLMDPVYITGAPKTFVLKFCIGLITGLVAHKIAKINESTDKKYVFKWSVIASVAGLAFNVVADPIVGYFYKQYILGQPQELAQALAKMSAVATLFNAVVSVILVAVIYNAVRPVLIKSHLLTITGKKKEQAA